MREIKFRQRIKGPREFPDRWHYWGYVGEQGHFVGPIGLVEWDARESQQYTGLKDKNGKEIYEGDTGVHYDYFRGSKISYTGVVEYQAPSFIVREIPEGWDKVLHSGFEVIGNIYENPELQRS